MTRTPMPFDHQFDFDWRPDPLPLSTQERLLKEGNPSPSAEAGSAEAVEPVPGERTVADVLIIGTLGEGICVHVAPHPNGGWFVFVDDEHASEGSTYLVNPSQFDEFPTLGEIIDIMETVECSPLWVMFPEVPEMCRGIVERFWREDRMQGMDPQGSIETSSSVYPRLEEYWKLRFEHFKASI